MEDVGGHLLKVLFLTFLQVMDQDVGDVQPHVVVMVKDQEQEDLVVAEQIVQELEVIFVPILIITIIFVADVVGMEEVDAVDVALELELPDVGGQGIVEEDHVVAVYHMNSLVLNLILYKQYLLHK